MIALDSNYVLRLLLEDDASQLSRVRALVDAAIANDDLLYISDVVICEVVWVLSRARRVGREELVGVLGALLAAAHLHFASRDRIARAAAAFARGAGGFADYLIREHAREAGCDFVATFDRALLREDGFRAP